MLRVSAGRTHHYNRIGSANCRVCKLCTFQRVVALCEPADPDLNVFHNTVNTPATVKNTFPPQCTEFISSMACWSASRFQHRRVSLTAGRPTANALPARQRLDFKVGSCGSLLQYSHNCRKIVNDLDRKYRMVQEDVLAIRNRVSAIEVRAHVEQPLHGPRETRRASTSWRPNFLLKRSSMTTATSSQA